MYPEVVKASTVSQDTYENSNVVEDQYDQELRTALEANRQAILNEQRSNNSFSTNAVQPANIISQLIKLVFKNMVKHPKGATPSVLTKATTRGVRVRLSGHAIERAAENGITSSMVDDVLSEKPYGMLAVEKYEDLIQNSKIMVDRNNNVIIILSNTTDQIFSIYRDTSTGKNSVLNRAKQGKWKKSNFIFKGI